MKGINDAEQEILDEIEVEKARLKQAGQEVLEWLETLPLNRLAAEHPWWIAGAAVGVGFALGKWSQRRSREA
ncbi:MAG: hypothetical protein RJB38_618 [Pseudomonadota bacterium]|jgi:hypothetical protein